MRITCPGCSAEFNVDDGRIPPQGTTVRCPKCFKAVEVTHPSETESLDSALLGGAADVEPPMEPFVDPPMDPPLEEDPITGELSRPGVEEPAAAIPTDASVATPSSPARNTEHFAVPGGGQVDDVWAGSGDPKQRETELGMSAPEAEAPQLPAGSDAESIFDADLIWSEDQPAEATPPAEAMPPGEPVQPRVSGLDETAIAASPDIEELEQALADLEASSGVVSGVEGDPVDAEPGQAESFDLDGLDAGMDMAPQDVQASELGEEDFAPLGNVGGVEDFEIKRDTISQDDLSVDLGGLGEMDRGEAIPRKFEGGGPTIDDIDFDSLLDDLPGDESGGDTFFVDSPEGGDKDDPAFDGPKEGGGDSPFDMEEINFDNLDEFSDIGELTDAGSADGGDASDAVEALELDMGDDVMAPQASSAAPQPQDRPGATPTASDDTPQRRRPKKRSAMPMLALVVVLGIGVAGALMFGDGLLQLLSGDSPPAEQHEGGADTKKQAHERGSTEYATRGDYDRRVETLDKQIELGKGNKTATEEELLWVLAWYHFSYPGAFPEGAPQNARLAALRKQFAAPGTVFGKKLEAMELAAVNSWGKAKATFAEYMKLRNARQGELWQSDQQLMKAMVQEDYLLDAWILTETKHTDEARKKLVTFMEKQPTSLFGLYLEARLFYKEGELAKSEAALGKVLDKYPTHVTSKILLAEIEIEQKKFDEAVTHGRELVEAGVRSKDQTLEMRAYRIMVRALSLKGEPGRKELKDVLLKVVNKRSSAEEMVVALVRIYLDADENEKALTTLKMCKECAGQEYLLLMVQSMQRNEMLELALRTAQEALEKDKNNIDLLIVMSEISGQTGRHNSAMDYLRDVLRMRPDHLDAATRLAKLFLGIKQPANAREVLLEAEKYNEGNLSLEEMLVEINLQMNDDSGAASALRKVHLLKPDDIDVRLRLVEILVRLGNYKEAVPHFDVLSKRGLINARLRPGYAMALREVGRMDDALDMLKEVLRDDPSDYQTARNLATIYLGKKDYFKARQYLEMARRSRSNEPEVHHLIGICCLATEDMDCALRSYTMAVELEQENLLYRTEYAKVIYRLSETDEARKTGLQRMAKEQFDKIIKRYETDPSIPAADKDPDIYANRGRIFFSLGYYDKALKDFRRAVSMDQHRVDLLLAMGDSLFHVNKRNDAKKYYREVLDTGQNLAHANFYLGKTFMVEGKPKKAKAHFLASIDADFKKFPDAHRYLGNIYNEARFRDMAVKYYRNYLDLVPANSPQARDVQNTIERMR